MEQIGTIEILRDRVYKMDAECHCLTPTTVVVRSGMYPIYRDGISTFWTMSGKLDMSGPWRMGDGMFSMSPGGTMPSDIEVQFPSKRFGPDEWADLLTEDTFVEGHPNQRIRVSMM